jgi:hypothetical protein
MRPVLSRMLGGLEVIIDVPRAACRRLRGTPYPTTTERDVDSIMRYLDHWVSRRSGKGYVPGDFGPNAPECHGIQQVRQEICEFVNILLAKGLHDSILEIGLGRYGGSHILWRYIFDRVITVEFDCSLVVRFRLNERLDARSAIIVGRSEDPRTLEKVRACAETVDVLFIDGDHRYSSVASDWSMYHSLVRPGGVVAFHDSVCRLPDFGVASFLEQLSSGAVDGRRHVLNTICHSHHVGITFEEC